MSNGYAKYKARTAAKGTSLRLTHQAYKTSRSPRFRAQQIAKAPWLKDIITRMRGR